MEGNPSSWPSDLLKMKNQNNTMSIDIMKRRKYIISGYVGRRFQSTYTYVGTYVWGFREATLRMRLRLIK